MGYLVSPPILDKCPVLHSLHLDHDQDDALLARSAMMGKENRNEVDEWADRQISLDADQMKRNRERLAYWGNNWKRYSSPEGKKMARGLIQHYKRQIEMHSEEREEIENIMKNSSSGSEERISMILYTTKKYRKIFHGLREEHGRLLKVFCHKETMPLLQEHRQSSSQSSTPRQNSLADEIRPASPKGGTRGRPSRPDSLAPPNSKHGAHFQEVPTTQASWQSLSSGTTSRQNSLSAQTGGTHLNQDRKYSDVEAQIPADICGPIKETCKAIGNPATAKCDLVSKTVETFSTMLLGGGGVLAAACSPYSNPHGGNHAGTVAGLRIAAAGGCCMIILKSCEFCASVMEKRRGHKGAQGGKDKRDLDDYLDLFFERRESLEHEGDSIESSLLMTRAIERTCLDGAAFERNKRENLLE